MIGGLFYTDQLAEISQQNKRSYTRDEIQKQLPLLEPWLRASGWTYLHFALCRKIKKALFVQLPASCIEDVNNMKRGDRITKALVEQRLEPHLQRGTRLLDHSKAMAWAGKGLLIRCSVILNIVQNEGDLVELGEMDFRIFPICGKCGKHLEKRSACAGCLVVSYCSPECQQAHWKSSHKQQCTMLKEAVIGLERYYQTVTPPGGQRTLAPNK